jgi:hypothetical protein
MKLQAGTLLYALAISLVIGMITTSVLINEQYNRILIQRDVIREEVTRNARSGINYLCAQQSENGNVEDDIDLYGRGKDSVQLLSRPWGIYDILIANAHTGDQQFQRIALAGSYPDAEQQYALWLGDMDRALKVCGNTELTGKCFLPKAGVERAYLEGKSYTGREMVYGSVDPSSRFVPEYNKERFTLLESLLKGELNVEDSLVFWNDLQANDTVQCSFSGPVCTVNHNSALIVSGNYLEGQICLRSSVSITVSANATLQKIVLIAPKIVVEDDVHGQFQIIARDSVIIGKNVHLSYPSAICLCAGKASPLETGIMINEGTEIDGTLFAVRTDELLQRQLLVDIQQDCIINGDIYTNDLLDLKGKVYGSVTCQKFSLTTNSARYENTLLDALINNTLYEPRPGGSVLRGAKRKEVITWLE